MHEKKVSSNLNKFATVANAMIAAATERLVPEMAELSGGRRTDLQKCHRILQNSIEFYGILRYF